MRSSFFSVYLFVLSASAIHLPVTRKSVSRRSTGTTRLNVRDVQSGTPGFSNVENNFYMTKFKLGGVEVPVQVDTGSSDVWLYNYQSDLLSTARTINSTNLTLNFGIGQVAGPLGQMSMDLGGFTVPNQTFLNVQSSKDYYIIDNHLAAGILGLGLDPLSHINSYVQGAYSGASWGRSIMSNIFDSNPTLSKHIAIRLDRLYDSNDTDTGSFDIGTFAPGLEAVNNTAPIPIFSFDAQRLNYWSVPLDAVSVNGANRTLNSSVTFGNTKPPAGKLSVLLDTGYSSPQITEDIFHALYSSMGGVMIQDGTNVTYAVPCTAEAQLVFYIGNEAIPIHPLDLTNVETFDKGSNMTVCKSMFEPFRSGGGILDMILGDSFLRNAYTVFGYGGLVDGFTGSPNSNPYVKILPLTDPTSASTEFKKARASQLATLPPEVNVNTFNDQHPQAAGSHTNSAGRFVCGSAKTFAAVTVAAALMLVV